MELFIWHQILQDRTIEQLIAAKNASDASQYAAAVANLIPFAEKTSVTNEIIREYVIRSMLYDENILAYCCKPNTSLGSVLDMAKHDIHTIQKELLLTDWDIVAQKYKKASLSNYSISTPRKTQSIVSGYAQSLQKMVESYADADAFLELICQHYMQFGAGRLAQYTAYRWNGQEILPIEEIDNITFAQLANIDYQRDVLIENTSAFLQGLPANHVLLCGNMGSGKSSCVKALLHTFADQKLRMVEVDKHGIRTLSNLLNTLRDQNRQYILFLDDLSFEGEDGEYKQLKVALEGQIARKPDNVLVYATSNRRNIVRDTWSDRTSSDDVHQSDTMNEKYSLSERFGVKLYFGGYDQSEYLNIVKTILEKEKITFDDTVQREALLWEKIYHGRSGRTAKNFAMQYAAKRKKPIL